MMYNKKRTVFLMLLLALFLITPEFVMGQTVEQRITFELQNRSLDEGLQELGKISGFRMAYSSQLVLKYKNVTVEKGVRSIGETLDLLLENTNLQAIIQEKRILIVEKKEESSSNGNPSSFQMVSGKVTDEKGEALSGVLVKIKNTTKGTITDDEGKFSLESELNEILIFSFLGMKGQEVTYTGQKSLYIVMENTASELSEVMITGYHQLPKERVTGAFSYLDEKELNKISSLNLKDKLEGLIPGLYFEPNFDEDQHPSEERSRSIVIRGVSTFGDSNPLIVVDGFPVSDAIDPWRNINPEDVANITVLKDAAAASIWGAQAANGVIVITTKRGRADAPQFSASYEMLLQPVPDLFKIPWASSKDAVNVYK